MGRVLSPDSAQGRAAEFSLSDAEFRFICSLVYSSTGIVLDERKREMVYRRLMRRLRETKLPTFSAYCDLLKNDEQELPAFINSITTNLTSFFRENHHFEYLKNHILPRLLQQNRNRRIRLWSAACSTGEEPYSIAMCLRETLAEQLSSWDIKILATDLDTECIAKAKEGIYRQDNIKDITPERQKRWFMKGRSADSNFVKIKPELAEIITFKKLNLLDDWPMQGPFDVIFCRNVLIYFDRQTQAELIDRYHNLLSPGGHLMLGHSESLPQKYTGFEVKGRTIFCKM